MKNKKESPLSTFQFKAGWVQDKQQGPLYGVGQNRNYSRQVYEDDLSTIQNYNIFDDKQIKEALKGVKVQEYQTNSNQVHLHGPKIVPIFCKEGYGVNYVKQQLPEYHQLPPDRYKTIIKAIIRRGIRHLQGVIAPKDDLPNSTRYKMSNHQYNQIVTPLMHCQKRMPFSYRIIWLKVLKNAYGVGPNFSKQQGKRLYEKLRLAAIEKSAFFEDPDAQRADQLDQKFKQLGLKAVKRRSSGSRAPRRKKDEDGQKKKKKKKKKKQKEDRISGQQIQQECDEYKKSSNNKRKSSNKNENSETCSNNESQQQQQQIQQQERQQDIYDQNYHADNYWSSKLDLPFEDKPIKKIKQYKGDNNKGDNNNNNIRGDNNNNKRLINNKVDNNNNNEYLSSSSLLKKKRSKYGIYIGNNINNEQSDNEQQSVIDELIWPDQIQYLIFQLLIQKFSYKYCCEGLTKIYPQNNDYFTPVVIQQFVQQKINKLFKDITDKYIKHGYVKQSINIIKQSINKQLISNNKGDNINNNNINNINQNNNQNNNNDKQSILESTLASKPISLFLMLKTHYIKIYKFMMRSNSAKQPRKHILKLYLSYIKHQYSLVTNNNSLVTLNNTSLITLNNNSSLITLNNNLSLITLNNTSYDINKSDILQIQRQLNNAFEKKITSDNIKVQQFNGDYDQALQTDTNDYQYNQKYKDNYRFRVNAKKHTHNKVNFQLQQKQFLNDLHIQRKQKQLLWNKQIDKQSIIINKKQINNNNKQLNKQFNNNNKQSNNNDYIDNDKIDDNQQDDSIINQQKAVEAYLRQPVKKSITPDTNLQPPKPIRSRKPRTRKSPAIDIFGNRRTNDRSKTKSRNYRAATKNPDILDQLSGSQLDQHDQYDWFHTQQNLYSSTQGRYGGVINNDYGYDNRAILPSLGANKKANTDLSKIVGGLNGLKNMLSNARILQQDDQDGGIIEID